MAAVVNLVIYICLLIASSFNQILPTKFNKNNLNDVLYMDEARWIQDGLLSASSRDLKMVFRHQIIIQRIQLESKYNISYAMARSTKHGPVSLVLCLKPFKVELSICVDASINPGPYGDTSRVQINDQYQHGVRGQGKSHLTTFVRRNYSRTELISFYVMSHIPNSLHVCLKNFGLLGTTRVKRAGKYAQSRFSNDKPIPVIMTQFRSVRPRFCAS